jgi:tRNA A37 N6-isopentenylltransferase MiaA
MSSCMDQDRPWEEQPSRDYHNEIRAERDALRADCSKANVAMVAALRESDTLRAERDRLKAALEVAREALKPFSDYAPDAPESIFPNNVSFTQGSPLAKHQLTFGNLRNARAAIAAIQEALRD